MSVAINSSRKAHILRSAGCVIMAGLLGMMFVIGSAGTSRADDEDETIDTRFMRNVLRSLGLRSGDEPGIDYHERSPLVVPPTRDLPPPDRGLGAISDPAWPKDPDIQRRRTAKRTPQLTTSEAEEEEMRPLRPDELRAMRRGAGRSASGAAPAMDPDSPGALTLLPSQLGFKGFNWSWKSLWDKEGTAVPFVKEPERTSLTEPPPGLRTPSPRFGYGHKGKLEPTREIGTDTAVGVE